MPELPRESEDRRAKRGEYFAVLKRLERTKAFFDSVWDIQPRVMALFGTQTKEIFLELHQARQQVEISAGLLFQRVMRDAGITLNEDTQKLRAQQRADLFALEAPLAEEGNRVGVKLLSFGDRMEALCRPIVERGYRQESGLIHRLLGGVCGENSAIMYLT